MEWNRLPLRFETLGSPSSSPRSAVVSSGRDDPEIEALLEGFFTERTVASTARDTVRSVANTERGEQRDDALKAQANRLQGLGAAVDLAYADYVVQQHDFESPRWPRDEAVDAGGEAVNETRRTLTFDDRKLQDGQADLDEDVIQSQALDLNLGDDENRVVQFDVGGSVFRCKACVISKYPGKRLFQIVDGGCDRFTDTDTFFIDRSARNFEIILDWYRTGKVFLSPGVNQESLEEDARYFGVYDEILPLVYRIRTHEQLVVASVMGHGKLMVRVCDPTGMQAVHVDQAVLFDSKTRFYLDGAQANLPLDALLPGDYVYTLWVQPHDEEGADKRSGPTSLDVELNLLSTYSNGDLVGSDGTPIQHQEPDSAPRQERAKRDAGSMQQPLSPLLFLPPFMQVLYEQTRDQDTHPRINKGKNLPAGRVQRAGNSLTLASPKPKINYVARAAAVSRAAARQPQPTNLATDLLSSPIRRTGASIISPTKPLGTGRIQDGKITIHRPEKLDFMKRGY